ncbi:MAG TPA: hypothetical protein VGM91_20710 [Conexibacter sp.]|jgi:beta-mannosidase
MTLDATARTVVDGHLLRLLDVGWEVASSTPNACATPADVDELSDWLPATVPGTVAGALRASGMSDAELALASARIDDRDWWFRLRFEQPPADDDDRLLLRLDGISTVSEVFLDSELVLRGESMFAAHTVELAGEAAGPRELAICCRALTPLLRVRRKPRARWRTRLVAEANLRFFRTSLLGRAPGFAEWPPAVGPWRPVALERERRLSVERLRVRATVGANGDASPTGDGVAGDTLKSDATVAVAATVRLLGPTTVTGATLELRREGEETRSLPLSVATAADGSITVSGAPRAEAVARWWPHTHGEPTLYEASLRLDAGGEEIAVDAGRVGFRSLDTGPDGEVDLCVNGVPVFARGAVWTPLDLVTLASEPASLRAALEQVRAAGMNMVRIPGTSVYESAAFHDLCDELGLLVWQDLMFANMDYPIADEQFRATVERELGELFDEIGGRPSLAVVCGGSEVEQQASMLGLPESAWRGELFATVAPRAFAAAEVDAAWIPSAPSGGALPFRPGAGVANYYGVGGYRRPLSDARLAEVRFASECLAFANVPEQATVDSLIPHSPSSVTADHPAWKAGVPRDNGSGWDFDDVRDHYLAHRYGVDPGELRRVDHARYLDLSRELTGELMAEVMGEWRRAASPNRGGLILWLRDLVPGAGWGVIDSNGIPKAAYHHLRRALAPLALWTTDEGLAGNALHVANDGPRPFDGELRVALYRDQEQLVEEAAAPLRLDPHDSATRDAEQLLGRFADISYAYRFGPPAHDVVVTTLQNAEGAPCAQAFRFPAGHPLVLESAARLGLEGQLGTLADGRPAITLHSRRLAWGVRIDVPGHLPHDDALTLEPGRPRTVALHPTGQAPEAADAFLTALNLVGRVRVSPSQPEAA